MSMTPHNKFTFVIDMTGDRTGTNFKGKFVYVRPTVGMRRDVDQIEFILNSQYQEKYQVKELAEAVKNYNHTIAYLKVCLETCPDWFKESDYGLSLEDENVLDAISFKIRTYEDIRIRDLQEILLKPRQKIEEENVNG